MRLSVLDGALADADATAFVHVAHAGDPTLHALSGAAVPTRAAVVYDGTRTLLPDRPLPGSLDLHDDVTVRDPVDRPARRLPDFVGDTVLAPRTIPHDAALYLEETGVTLTSTDAHERAREAKSASARETLRAAQRAAEAGTNAAAERIANASGDPLADEEGRVTAERVRRAANAAIARAGADPAGNTVVDATGPLDPHATVPIRLAPSVDGYHGLLARTFVPESDGGWERRATLACEYAVDAAMDVVDVGDTTAAAAASEAAAELGSYGFPPTAGSAAVHGVGLERREAPVSEDTIEPDAVLAVSTELDADDTVWIADVGVVTESGVERIGEFPRSVVPNPEY